MVVRAGEEAVAKWILSKPIIDISPGIFNEIL
jgi:hypothetical protein